MHGQSIDGAILAGGRSRRMGGAPKCLLDLAGRTMLERVLGRFEPQVRRVVLSVERPAPEWARFGLAQVADPVPGQGHLSGFVASPRDLEVDLVLALEADFPVVQSPCGDHGPVHPDKGIRLKAGR